jgi:hypothetical protein
MVVVHSMVILAYGTRSLATASALQARDPWLNDPGERDAVLRANMKVIARRGGPDSR